MNSLFVDMSIPYTHGCRSAGEYEAKNTFFAPDARARDTIERERELMRKVKGGLDFDLTDQGLTWATGMQLAVERVMGSVQARIEQLREEKPVFTRQGTGEPHPATVIDDRPHPSREEIDRARVIAKARGVWVRACPDNEFEVRWGKGKLTPTSKLPGRVMAVGLLSEGHAWVWAAEQFSAPMEAKSA